MQKHRFGAAGMQCHKRTYVRTDRLLHCAGVLSLNSLFSRELPASALIRFKRCLVCAWDH